MFVPTGLKLETVGLSKEGRAEVQKNHVPQISRAPDILHSLEILQKHNISLLMTLTESLLARLALSNLCG